MGPGDDCEAVNCMVGFFQTIDADGKLVRYEYDGTALDFEVISTFGFSVNATAFNILDNFFYTISQNDRRLIRFSSDGTWTSVGEIDLPETVLVGSFDNDGNYYVKGINTPSIFKIDIATLTFEVITPDGPILRAADWAYISCENKFYAVGRDNLLYSYDPVTNMTTVTNLFGDLETGLFGAAFTDINGVLYVSNNSSGNIYSVDVTTGEFTLLLNGPAGGTNDGTSCPCANPPFPTLFPEDDEICISENVPFEVLLNDAHSFAELDLSSFSISQQPTNGSVTYTESTGSVVYQSNDSTQPDSFIYSICLDLNTVFCEEATVRFLPSYNTIIEESICEGEEVVVDGSVFTEEGSYDLTYIAINGCDSIVTLNLEVFRDVEIILEEEICAEEEFMFNNEFFTETGLYEFDFTTESGCDSLLVLDLTVNAVYEETINQEICEGEEFVFDGEVYDAEGIYTIQYLSANGCDSTYTINLLVHSDTTVMVEESICDGSDFELNGEIYSEAGEYIQMLNTVNGCDSIITIQLEVKENVETELIETICEGEEFVLPDGSTLTEPGEYTIDLIASTGCDSTLSLSLNVLQNAKSQFNEIICANEVFTLPDGTEFSESGDYEVLYTAANGCDSTLTLSLLVNEVFEEDRLESICLGESIFIGDMEFVETGNYTANLISAQNCDSIINLTLEVRETFLVSFVEEICTGDSYAFGDLLISESGTFEQNLLTSNGCDSTLILELRVLENRQSDIQVSICEGGSFELGQEIYTEAGEYTAQFTAANGCDSLVTLDLDVAPKFTLAISASICEGEFFEYRGVAYDEAGEFELFFAGQNGCDSTVTLNLNVLDVFELEFDREICAGETYEIGTSLYDSPGTYFDTFVAASGCDSTIITHLVVNDVSTTEIEQFTCMEDEVGQEQIVLTNVSGCDSTIMVSTILSPVASCMVIASVDGMTIPCMEETGILSFDISVGTPPFTISVNGPTSGTQMQPVFGNFVFEDLLPGSYSIVIVDANGNSINLFADILEFEVPNVVADIPLSSSGFSVDCFGDQNGFASATAIGGAAPYTFMWSTGEVGEEIQNLSAGLYTLTLTDANSCEDIIEVEITEPPALELSLDATDLTCDNPLSGMVTVASSGGVMPYTYTLNDSEAQTENTFLDLEEDDYLALVTDANGCIAEEFFSLTMPTAVEVSLGGDLSISLGETIQIQALLNIPSQNIEVIEWSSNIDSDCNDCLIQTLMPSGTDTITIYVLDDNGCEFTDQIIVRVDTEQGIYIPNAFSPNGDGINDVFTLYSSSAFRPIIRELHIYDRWGTEVFERYDFPPNEDQFGWNGDFRDEPHNSGVFVYHATVEFIDGTTASFKGDVSLVK